MQQILPQSNEVLGTKGGKSTKSFVSQLPLREFSWVDDSLLEGSVYKAAMTVRPSGKIAAAEREGVTRG